MDFEKIYKEIVGNLDSSSFDSMMEGFENLLDLLEKMQSADNCDESFVLTVMNKAEEIKKESIQLLSDQRKEIIDMANESGISLKELGISPEEPDFE